MTIVLPRGSMVKNLTARQESQFRSLGWEDPLEEEMATHSCLGNLRDREEPGRLWSMGSQRVGHNLATEPQQLIGCNIYLAILYRELHE